MVRSGMQVSYSIRLRIGYSRGLCRGSRRLPPSVPIESLAEGQQPRRKGLRRIRGPVFSPLFGKGLPACFGGRLGAADNVFQDSQGDEEKQESHRTTPSLLECAVGPHHSRPAGCPARDSPPNPVTATNGGIGTPRVVSRREWPVPVTHCIVALIGRDTGFLYRRR